MKQVLIVCAALGILTTTQVQADSPSFTYVELEYIASGDFEVNVDSLSLNSDIEGFALGASVELGIFFLQASRFELESDEVLGTIAEDSISTIAAGIAFELPRAQVYGLIRGRRDEVSSRGLIEEDEDAGTVGGEVGVRVNLTDRLELNANIGRPSPDEGSSYGVGAQFFITDNIGLTLDFSSIEAEDDDDSVKFDTTSVGERFTF